MTTPFSNQKLTFLKLKPAIWLLAVGIGAVAVWRWQGQDLPDKPSPKVDAVSLAGPGLIAVQPGIPLEKKLELTTVKQERISSPLLSVTGAVMARLRSGVGLVEDRWQFSSVELSAIYADWQKAGTEMEFAAKQLTKTRELTAAQLTSQTKVVDRLRKLVATGTEAARDLSAAEASLLQTQLEGQKAVFEAESALTQATHSHADFERHLLQAGIDPALLQKVPTGASLVMADVPEVRIGLVAVGQGCEARFYGLNNQVFKGTVRSLSPALSPERRTLRVYFELNDPDNKLKPGMYAEIGLGTDPRTAILAPADGILHITDGDYVLTEAQTGIWKVTEVQVGERAGDRVEILDGLTGGERMIGNGAILLKPLVVQALLKIQQSPATSGASQP
ncbi:efflux RND transporter periplasmic adaptor subunit [Methylomonas sp. EFPC3]|uniref:efflux RND transporter periplasmic adaptor subunit n=1 Tax=unclassified Methylomonas TaxID=2608980 RepID=UPI002415A706|nr:MULTISPECIES: efflux RND transporter periplasmic adaptor subunit [unclassified Methylomonas]WFP50398.1 efflux RND transporter periplasmic adaptor subunit [Methylomonas sp. EFPC3]WGS85073.1 efflux RND transporter periplasmic adaptor subunit [Methylomonas sp. UP202]